MSPARKKTSTRSRRNAGQDDARTGDLSAGPALRTFPHSIETEQALLACCVIDGGQDSITQCVEAKLTPDSFYRAEHQILFEALLELYEAGTPVDEIILADKLQSKGDLEKVGGYVFLNNLTSRVEVAAHLPYYLKRVKDLATLRRLIKTATRTIEQAYSTHEDLGHFLESVEQEFFKISDDRISDSAKPLGGPTLEAAMQMVQDMIQRKGEINGISSGFVDLDRKTLGWHPQEMIVVAARPSMGKTSIALNMAEAAILPKPGQKPVSTLIFSLEMGAEQLAFRLLCGRARANMQKLGDGFVSRETQADLARAAQELKDAPLWIDDSAGLTILEIRAKARRIHAQRKLGMVIVDYLQLVQGDSSIPREQQIAEISRGMKAMAKELNLPVIVLGQLNRESEKEKRQPRASDLRESGSIEQDADVVLLLARKKDSDEDREREENIVLRDLIIAKQRNGAVGVVTLTFNKTLTRFENYTPLTE